METCNNQQQTNNTMKVRGCRRKMGAVVSKEEVKAGNPAKKRRPLDPVFAAVDPTNKDLSSGMATLSELNNQAVRLYKKGDFGLASTLFKQAVALWTKEPLDLLATPHTNSKSCCCHHQESVERVVINYCGNPPPSSYIYQRLDFDEGMTVYGDTVEIRDDDHPDAVEATLLFNMGHARRKLNDMEGASRHYDRALRTFAAPGRTVSSIRTVHSIIIPILHNVGQLTYRNGQLLEAIKLYDVALRHARDIHGKNDISVGFTLNCLGVLCYHLSTDRSDRAKRYFEDALLILNKVLGEDSLQSATTLNNIGRVHVQREEFEQALVHYEMSLKIRKQLGPDHIDYAATAFNAGQSLHQRGCYDRALTLYQEFLRVALKIFSRNHRDVAVVLSGIAQIYQEQKEFDKALSLYEESLAVGRAALGNSHSEVAMLLNRLGNFHFDRGNFDKALVAYNEGLQIERKVLDMNHPNIVVTLSNIAEIYRQRTDYPKSIRLYEEVLRLQRKCYGESSVEVAATLNVLGLIYDLQGNSIMALKCLQQALVIRRTVLGDNHLDLSATLIYLGSIFYRRGAASMAMQLFSESLRIRIESHGRDHRDVSFTLYNIGLCLQMQGSYKEAIKCYTETLRIEKLVLGETHKDVSMTYLKLGEVLSANRDYDQALESFQSSLRIERSLQDNADPMSIAMILNEIGNIYLMNGKTGPMISSFIEASRVLKEAGLPPFDSLSLPGQLYAFSASCPCSASAA